MVTFSTNSFIRKSWVFSIFSIDNNIDKCYIPYFCHYHNQKSPTYSLQFPDKLYYFKVIPSIPLPGALSWLRIKMHSYIKNHTFLNILYTNILKKDISCHIFIPTYYSHTPLIRIIISSCSKISISRNIRFSISSPNFCLRISMAAYINRMSHICPKHCLPHIHMICSTPPVPTVIITPDNHHYFS